MWLELPKDIEQKMNNKNPNQTKQIKTKQC